VLAVDESCLHVHDRVVCEDAVLYRALEAFLAARDELSRDDAADDRVFELEAVIVRHRFEIDVADAELPVAARLLLLLALDVRRPSADRLAIGDARRPEATVDRRAPPQPLERDVEVQRAEPLDEHLAALRVVLEGELRVLFAD